MSVTNGVRWAVGAGPICWWAFVAWQMSRDMQRAPGPTGLPDDLPNLHNGAGDLKTFVVMALVELAVVTVILRPWSYDRSWGRALGALVVLVPWTLLFLIMLIHSGGVMLWHVRWLLGLVLGTATLTVTSGAVAVLARRHRPSAHGAAA